MLGGLNMVLTLIDAQKDKFYRIRAFRNMPFPKSEEFRKHDIVEGVRLIVISKTSYDFYLLHIRLHNGKNIKWAVDSITAKQIDIEADNSGERNV